MTAAVIEARDKLVSQTAEMTKVYKPGAFMTRKVDPRTMDKYLLNITPQEMAQIASTDPNLAEQYAARINTLEQRIPTTQIPAQDQQEPS